jgi:hypothetical protein
VAVYRTVYQIEVFSEEPFEARGDSTDPFDLQAISWAITDGECIGNVEQVTQEIVPTEKVKAELLRIGNDGHFFDYLGDNFD